MQKSHFKRSTWLDLASHEADPATDKANGYSAHARRWASGNACWAAAALLWTTYYGRSKGPRSTMAAVIANVADADTERADRGFDGNHQRLSLRSIAVFLT